MSGFTAPPDNSAPPPGASIDAGPWFPAIQTDDIRQKVRLGDGAVTADRLSEAAIAGILAARNELRDWQSAQIEAGAATLADVTSETLAGENLAELIWRRIVMFYAAADLLDGHTDVAATDEALDREDEKRDTADSYRRKAYDAVADMLAIAAGDAPARAGRNMVDLL